MAGDGDSFGAILRRLRLAADLSQEALAERARMSVDAIGALERGTRHAPQRQTLALLVEALQLNGEPRAELEAAAVRPARPRHRTLRESSEPESHNLPIALTSFIGREGDVAAIDELVRENHLVTLVGPGGVGKSRLAAESARGLLHHFSDVKLVELASISDPKFAIAAVCQVLGVREDPSAPLHQTLLAALRDSNRLVILDNCEHVLDAVVELVTPLLRTSPALRVLATSRESLRVDGEVIFRVEPLDESLAIRLFIERAKAVTPMLKISNEEQASLSAICRSVDGIPLAIELAAARVNILSLPTIADRLERRFSLLTVGPRTAIPQHRTLRALVDWSYDLLTEQERSVFRRLAVCAGGCTLEAARSIAANGDVDETFIVDILSRLHDKSLIFVDRREHERFGMLHIIREYALEKLEESGERPQLERKHAEYFLNFVGAHELSLKGMHQRECATRIKEDIDNIRAALDAVDRYVDLEAPARAALWALSRYWILTGGLSEGRLRLAGRLKASHERSVSLAAGLCGASWVTSNEGRLDDAKAYAERAVEAAGDADEWTRTYAMLTLLVQRLMRGESINEDKLIASKTKAEGTGDPWLTMHATYALALHALASGDLESARAYFEKTLESASKSGDHFALAATSINLARFIFAASDPVQAAHYLADAALVLEADKNVPALAACLEALAPICVRVGKLQDAARLIGAADQLRKTSGTEPRLRAVADARDQLTAALRPEQYHPLWEEGNQMQVDGTAERIRRLADELELDSVT